MNDQKIFQRHTGRLFFRNADLDFYLLQFLGYGAHGGATVGECLRAAAQIDEARPDSWVAAWRGLAEQLEAAGKAALAAGHTVSARESLLRAVTYYRAASTLLPPDERLRANWERLRACFRRAAALAAPPVETVAIPYGSWQLPGYLVHGGPPGAARPVVIMVGGGECYAEELYFWAGVPGARRGYHVLLLDLPSQVAGPLAGLDVARLLNGRAPDELARDVFAAILDYLAARPDVDATRIAANGISGGGYLTMAGAVEQPRLAALALSTPIYDIYRVFEAEWPPALRAVPAFVGDTLVKAAARVNPITRIVLQKALWTVGATSVAAYMDIMRRGAVDPARILCPALCLAGSGDPAECIRQTHEAYDRLPHPAKAKRLFTPETGADAHCQVNNLPLVYQVVFDWLDEVL